MNRKAVLRILATILFVALMGTGATAATLSDLLEHAKSQGFTVKVKSSSVAKATIAYTESSKRSDKLAWTDGNKKSYSITVSSHTSKANLRDLFIYMVNNYKWKSGAYTIDKVITYGFNIKNARNTYRSLVLFRKAVKKHIQELSKGKRYVLNTSTKKFHLPECSDVKRISEQNKQIVNTTREHLISEGYSPCKHCNP